MTERIEDDTYAVLAELEDEDETFGERFVHLVRERRKIIREGAGLWSGTDAAEEARKARLK